MYLHSDDAKLSSNNVDDLQSPLDGLSVQCVALLPVLTTVLDYRQLRLAAKRAKGVR